MSTIKVNAIQNTAGVEQYLAKAWVNFNGTGTVAIRASGNVSSITDNGTGDYTVNFTNAMADANYAVLATTDGSTNLTSTEISAQTTSTARIKSTRENNSTTGTYDAAIVCVAVFR